MPNPVSQNGTIGLIVDAVMSIVVFRRNRSHDHLRENRRRQRTAMGGLLCRTYRFRSVGHQTRPRYP